MRRATQRGRAQAGHATRTEVMQLERQLAFGIVAGALQEIAHDLLHLPAHRGHGHRIPHAQQQGLQIRRHPERLGVGGFDRHQHVVRGHHAAFGHRTDADRQLPTQTVDDIAPAGLVERFAMRRQQRLGIVDVGVRHRTVDRFFQDRLQAEERGLVVHATARFHVEKRGIGARWILQPVAGLVAVGVEQQVVEIMHDGSSFASGGRRSVRQREVMAQPWPRKNSRMCRWSS